MMNSKLLAVPDGPGNWRARYHDGSWYDAIVCQNDDGLAVMVPQCSPRWHAIEWLTANRWGPWERVALRTSSEGGTSDAPSVEPMVLRTGLNHLAAATQMDWGQVCQTGCPPCFHIEEGLRFCGRSQQWPGHDSDHRFTSLADMVRGLLNNKVRHGSEPLPEPAG